MPIIKHIPIYSAPKKLLSYAANEKKSEKTLITGLNCSSNAADAYEEMKVNFEMSDKADLIAAKNLGTDPLDSD